MIGDLRAVGMSAEEGGIDLERLFCVCEDQWLYFVSIVFWLSGTSTLSGKMMSRCVNQLARRADWLGDALGAGMNTILCCIHKLVVEGDGLVCRTVSRHYWRITLTAFARGDRVYPVVLANLLVPHLRIGPEQFLSLISGEHLVGKHLSDFISNYLDMNPDCALAFRDIPLELVLARVNRSSVCGLIRRVHSVLWQRGEGSSLLITGQVSEMAGALLETQDLSTFDRFSMAITASGARDLVADMLRRLLAVWEEDISYREISEAALLISDVLRMYSYIINDDDWGLLAHVIVNAAVCDEMAALTLLDIANKCAEGRPRFIVAVGEEVCANWKDSVDAETFIMVLDLNRPESRS
jgi:hypothetical protein